LTAKTPIIHAAQMTCALERFTQDLANSAFAKQHSGLSWNSGLSQFDARSVADVEELRRRRAR